MYPIETAENWKIPNLIWWINVKLAEMESLSIVKQNNPWNAHSIFEFSYFCCPECDSKLPVKQDFIDHASINHPWVSLRYSFVILNLITYVKVSHMKNYLTCVEFPNIKYSLISIRQNYNFDMLAMIWHEIVCWFLKIYQDLKRFANTGTQNCFCFDF